MGICFWCSFRKLFISVKLFENAKRTEIYLELFWYKIFVYLKLTLLDFLSDFLLNIFVYYVKTIEIPGELPKVN